MQTGKQFIPSHIITFSHQIGGFRIPQTNLFSILEGDTLRRQCGKNSGKTCLCQGISPEKEGQSYTFGCSWSLYNHAACKFSKSGQVSSQHRSKTSYNCYTYRYGTVWIKCSFFSTDKQDKTKLSCFLLYFSYNSCVP